MDSKSENALRNQLLRSNGKLLSGFSHELKNQIAVIKESVGLLQDFVEMGRIGEGQLRDKIKEITTRLEKRTENVGEMARQLNSFSHRFDAPITCFDLHQMVDEQYFLFKRFARLQKIKVCVKIADTPLYIQNHPSLLQHLIQILFEQTLSHLNENDEAHFFTALDERMVSMGMCFISRKPLAEISVNSILTTELQLCLQKTGAEIEFQSPKEKELEIRLSFPEKVNEEGVAISSSD